MKGIKFCGSENCCICEESLSLRTENKRLTDLCTSTRHELNRLALKISPKGECLLDQKHAETERLREALEAIKEIDSGGGKRADDYGCAYRIAKQALQEKDVHTA